MGYGYYEVVRNGVMIPAGWDVEDVCNWPDCETQIDRGLAFLCGATPGGDEWGCGGYFCCAHLYLSLVEGHPQMCASCKGAVSIA